MSATKKLRPDQKKMIDAVTQAYADGLKRVVLQMPTGCHRIGQRLIMFDGSVKSVEDVEVGDLLLGPDGAPREVLELCRGRGRMVRVVPDDGDEFVVNDDHILTLDQTIVYDGLSGVVDVAISEYKRWSHNHKDACYLLKIKDSCVGNFWYDLSDRVGFRIEDLPSEEDFYGFILSDDHRYLMEDFTVTHNSGKTFTAAELLKRTISKKKRGMFVVHLDAIIEDTIERFREDGLRVGRLQASHDFDIDAEVYVASMATMISRDYWPKIDFLIYDEVHHSSADGASQIFEKYTDIHILGLSATPETSNGRGLAHLFQKLILGPQAKELIDAGILVKPHVYCPYTQGKSLARDPVEALKEFAPGRQSAVFARNSDEAREIQGRLASSALYLDDTPTKERKDIINALRSGSLDHVVTVRALMEGADVKPISAVVTCTKFASAGGWLQVVGRGLRSDKNKKDCIVIDLMGAALEWGLPDEDRAWTLEGKASHRMGPTPTPLMRCKECLAIFDRASACPRCGAATKSLEKPVQSRVQPRDMRLLLPEDAIIGKAQTQLNRTIQILMLKGMFPALAEKRAREKAPRWIKDALKIE